METILRATVTRICNLHFPPPIQAAPSSQQYRMEPGQLHPTKDMLAVRGDALWTKWSQSQWLGYSHVPHLKLIMIPLLDIVHGYLKFKPLPRSCNILYQGPVNCSPWPNSVNKVFLGHSHALSFAYHLWLPLCYDARTEQLFQKVSGPQSWNISCQTLFRANMSTWLFEMSPVPHLSHIRSSLCPVFSRHLILSSLPRGAWISCLRICARATVSAWNSFLHDFDSLTSLHFSGLRWNADSTISISNSTPPPSLISNSLLYLWHM